MNNVSVNHRSCPYIPRAVTTVCCAWEEACNIRYQTRDSKYAQVEQLTNVVSLCTNDICDRWCI